MKKWQQLTALTLFIAILFPNLLYANWVQADGPFGGYIWCIATKGDTVFAGTHSGVFRSTDNGAAWTALNKGLPKGVRVVSLAVNGNDVFAGTYIDGVFLFNGNTGSWTAVNNGLPQLKTVAFVTSISDTLFAGVGVDDNLYRSVDRGANWTRFIDSLPARTAVYSVFRYGAKLFIGTSKGVFLSSWPGGSWSAVDSGPPVNAPVRVFVAIGGNLLAGTANSSLGVCLSSDSGATWSQSNTGITGFPDISSFAVIGDTVFAGATGGIFKSGSGGTSWVRVTGLPVPDGYCNITALAVSGTRLFAGTSMEGVFLSCDSGATWTPVNTGLAATTINSLVAIGDTVFAWSESAICRIAGKEAGWTRVRACHPMNSISTSMWASGGTLFIRGDCGIDYSIDKGAIWSRVDPTGTNTGVQGVVAEGGGDVFVRGIHGEFYFSTDNGSNWITSDSVLTANTMVGALAVNGSVKIAATGNCGILHSTDNFKTWSVANSGVSSSTPLYSFKMCGTTLFAGGPGGFRQSVDNGSTWTVVKAGLPANAVATSLAVSGETIFAGIYEKGVYVSIDEGRMWRDATADLPLAIVRSLVIRGNELYAGTEGGGVWRRPIAELTQAGESVPPLARGNRGMRLFFTRNVLEGPILEFTLNRSVSVAIEVYDLAGKQVVPAMGGFFSQNTYRIPLAMQKLSSGCYLVKVRAGSETGLLPVTVY